MCYFLCLCILLISNFCVNAYLKLNQGRYSMKRRDISEGSTINQDEEEIVLEFAEDAPKITWSASAKASSKVKESERTVEDYMALPASEYSVLSADQIERLSDSQFKCTLMTMNFFGTKITPVLYVDVNVYPDEAKSVISVTKAETTGSAIAEKVNGTFSISAINTVSGGLDKKGIKRLSSQTDLNIDVTVPKSKIPLRVIRSSGNFMMKSTLKIIVEAFIRVLAADFRKWSEGNNERAAVEGASLS